MIRSCDVGRRETFVTRITGVTVRGQDQVSAPILLPQHPEICRNRDKNQASTENVEPPAVERFSHKIRGLPVMVLLYS